MAFFGLTRLGYQDTIREHVRNAEVTPQYVFRSGLYRDPTFRLPPLKGQFEDAERPTSATATGVVSDQTAAYWPGHRGSQKELVRLKEKHVANPQDLTDIYRRPVVTSADIARWRKDEPLRVKEPWTYVKRHVHVNSEMTRFTDQMALTNRDFSLF